MTETNQQHPMWHVRVTLSACHEEYSTDEDYWLRAPTASAALARAEAMRAGAPEPSAAMPTIRVRACIARKGNNWALIGKSEWKDTDAQAYATDMVDVFDGDDVQIDFGVIDVPLRKPAELTGAVEPKEPQL